VLRTLFAGSGYTITVDVEDVGGYVLERLHHTFLNHLARENDWVTYMFTGSYGSLEVLPHYLTRGTCVAIRSATTQVEVAPTDLLSYLRAQAGRDDRPLLAVRRQQLHRAGPCSPT